MLTDDELTIIHAWMRMDLQVELQYPGDNHWALYTNRAYFKCQHPQRDCSYRLQGLPSSQLPSATTTSP